MGPNTPIAYNVQTAVDAKHKLIVGPCGNQRRDGPDLVGGDGTASPASP